MTKVILSTILFTVSLLGVSLLGYNTQALAQAYEIRQLVLRDNNDPIPCTVQGRQSTGNTNILVIYDWETHEYKAICAERNSAITNVYFNSLGEQLKNEVNRVANQ